MTQTWPLISVVVPARDEAQVLARCLDSIVAQRWPAELLEVIVVENGSRDGTRAVAETWAARDTRIVVVRSDATNQAEAMNDGLRAARGDLVARVDAHSFIDDDYLGEVAAAFERHPEAAAVGGAFLPAGETLPERVAGLARSSRLGVGGGYGADRLAHDHAVRTVQCGAYRREALLTVGGFDPAMVYGEDDELNWRLLQRDLPVILCPALRQFYRPRASLAGLWRQYWNYGRGRMRVLRKHAGFLVPRHLAPSALILALAGLAAAGAVVPAAHAVLGLVAAAWGAVLVGSACAARGADWQERVLLPVAVAGMHLAYGAGLLREAGRRRAALAPALPLHPVAPSCPARPGDLPAISVVICTKDRPAPLASCLESLVGQTHPAREVIVVDASAEPAVDVTSAFGRRRPGGCVHLRSAPGLPRQRNAGARAACSEVVLFLDDDVVLEAGYLAAIARVYAADAAGIVGGGGGAQVPDPTPREHWLRRVLCRLFLLNGYGRGVVKRSGRVEYALSPRRRMNVEFLSGCNMSFRRAVLQTVAFDERLSGYALGEDLQFSYRVSRRWRLIVTPEARLEHRHAEGGRPRGDEFRVMAVFNKYLFVRECVVRRKIDWLAYAWAALGDAALRCRAPRARGLRGIVRGYHLVWRHLTRGELPAAYAGAPDRPRADPAARAVLAARTGGG